MDPPQPSTPSEPPPSQTTTPPPPTTTTTPEPPQPQSQPPPTTTPPPPTSQPPPTTTPSPQPPTPNPNPNPKPPIPLQQQPPRPPFPRGPPYTQPPPPFPHFSSITNHSTTPSSSITPSQRGVSGGMAIGVPAPSPPPPHPNPNFSSLNPPPFTSSHFATTTPQVRQSITGMQGAGMMGSLGVGSSLRPNSAALSHPQRPIQSSLRPQTAANNMPAAAQNFPEHGHVRLPSTASPAPTTSQSTQPWLNSGQARPGMPHPSFRPPMNSQSLQQRPHLPSQQQTTISTPTQPPQTISSLQPQSSSLSQQPQEQYSLPPSRVPHTLTPHQQQLARNRGLGNQRPFSQTVAQPTSPAPPPPTFNRPPAVVEATETCNRIISKRSIQEIVSQIDPSERLDPEVEDILVDIADEFVESVTTFACSLAKHRKSNTLESKDVLLHLERNWNMSLPGFGGDEIKCYKKPFGNDAHRERLAAIKRSVAAAEVSNTKTSGGPAGGGGGGGGGSGAKGHPAKAAPGLVIGSPNPKGS